MTDLMKTYLDFVCERHRVWERRQRGLPGPWTDDPILRTHKFTNMFRVLDYGSQFVARELLWSEPLETGDVWMRAFLYRYTNRPEPWLAFKEEFGRYPLRTDLERNLPDLWAEYKAGGYPVFGNAYKMFVGKENTGTDRLTWVTELTRRAFGFGENDVVDALQGAHTPEQKLAVLKTIPRCGDFMGMQILTDYGYWSSSWDEDAFCVPGPGAKVGAKAIGMKPQEAFEWARMALSWREDEPYLPVPGGLRSLSYMDVQNSFCEFGKYVRYMGGGPTRHDYRPAHPVPEPPFIPPFWVETGAGTDA